MSLLMNPAHARSARADIPSPDSIPSSTLPALASALRSALLTASVETVERGYIASMHTAQLAANPKIEDTFKTKLSLASESGALFGVFDGHTGRDASAFCQDELLDYLDYYRAQGYTRSVIAGTPFVHADEHFLRYALADKDYKRGFSGACALVTHIQQDVIRTASAGDCRAVVGRRRDAAPVSAPVSSYPAPAPSSPATTAAAGGLSSLFASVWGGTAPGAPASAAALSSASAVCDASSAMAEAAMVPTVGALSASGPRTTDGPVLLTPSALHSTSSHDAVELSVEHQIDTAFAERERLLAAHPYEEDLLRSNRVKGRLQPTRGVGDGVYKKNEFFAARDRLRERYGTWTAPYTTADPDITAYKLSPRDEFLVLASDGLFQELTPALVTKYVGEFMADASARDRHKGNCAAFLTEKALLHASEYAIGRRGAEKNLAWVLSLPTEAKRNFHDDITVMVLFFTKELAAGLPPKVMDTATGGRITAPATLQRAIRDAQTATAAAGAAAAMARGAPLDTVAESVLTVNDLVSSPPQELRANL